MNRVAILIILFASICDCSYGQTAKNKETPVDTIVSILNPSIGRVDDLDLSYSAQLKEKYGIKSFEFHKVNALDGSDCNFSYFDGEQYLPMSLDIGGYCPYDIYNDEKTMYVRAKYNKYIRNEENPIASKVEVIFYVYKIKNNKK